MKELRFIGGNSDGTIWRESHSKEGDTIVMPIIEKAQWIKEGEIPYAEIKNEAYIVTSFYTGREGANLLVALHHTIDSESMIYFAQNVMKNRL